MLTKPFTIRYELKSKEDYHHLLWMLRGVLSAERAPGHHLDWMTEEPNNTVIIDTNDSWLKTNLILFFGEGNVIYSR